MAGAYLQTLTKNTKKSAHVPDTRDEGDWRVLAVDDYPRISLETYERY